MNEIRVLVIGDFHTYHVPDQRRFTEQFARRLRQTGRPVTVTCYTPFALSAVPPLLAQIPLHRYDLIVLQVGHNALQDVREDGRKPLAQSSSNFINFLRGLTPGTLVRLRTIVRLGTVRQELQAILNCLQPYRQNVVILTPFPHRESFSHWLRKQGQRLLIRAGKRGNMQILDVYRLIKPREEYFLSGDSAHLNASSHELIGAHLYELYAQRTSTSWKHSFPPNSF